MCGFCKNISKKEDAKNNIDIIANIEEPFCRINPIRLEKVFYLEPRHIEIRLFKGVENIMEVDYCPYCGRKLKTGD